MKRVGLQNSPTRFAVLHNWDNPTLEKFNQFILMDLDELEYTVHPRGIWTGAFYKSLVRTLLLPWHGD